MEFAAKVALVFIILFVGIAYAIYIYTPTAFVVLPCSGTDISCGLGVCDDCNDHDSFVGEQFCSGKNIYQAYRDYYCENNECVYTESNKSIENCDLKDGWVDVESYSCCDGNNKCLCKKQAYIDYSCSGGYCVEKTTQERTVKVNCEKCIRCKYGDCIGCNSDSDCGKNEWIGEPQCSSGDVYQEYRTYKCKNPGTESSYCTFSDSHKLKKDCGSGGYDSWDYYCKHDDVYRSRNYFDRGCSDGKCYTNWNIEKEEKYKDCYYGCSDGSCRYSDYDCYGCGSCGCDKCSAGWTSNYRCSAGALQREYQYSDCRKEYREWEDCDALDDYVGSRYCKSGSVYQRYRDYYCSGNSCIYTEREDLIKTCSSRCSNGYCIDGQTCSGTDSSCGNYPNCVNCNANDGYIGSTYCFSGDVYKTYRDYSCSGTTCVEKDEKRLITDCSYDCSGGYCVEEQTCQGTDYSCGNYPNCMNCNSYDGYTGSKYCYNGDVYQDYRNYYCSGNSCIYTESKKMIEDCSYGCSSGYCTQQTYSCQGTDYSCGYYPNCMNCNSYDGYIGSRYCSGGNVYQTYRDYYCSGTSCTYTDRAVLVESCSYPCYSGTCGYYPYDYCTSSWLNDYKCYGSWLQRAYQYSDCGRAWLDWEYCTYGCSGGYCWDDGCYGSDCWDDGGCFGDDCWDDGCYGSDCWDDGGCFGDDCWDSYNGDYYSDSYYN